MKNLVLSIVVNVIFVSCFVVVANAGTVVTNAGLQKAISDIALIAANGNREGFAAKVQKLSQEMKDHRVDLCRQILIFMTIKHEALPQEAGWSILALYKHMNFTADEKVAAIVPLVTHNVLTLDGPGNERLGRSILREIDRPHGLKAKPDFAPYTRFLKASEDLDKPTWLMGYMFDQEPLEALTSLAGVYLSRAEADPLVQMTSGAPTQKATLRSLSDRPEWWARLYVAETMKKQPQLRNTAILKKLEKDDNPLVQKIIAEITSDK